MTETFNSMKIKRENRKKVFQFLCSGEVYTTRDIAYAMEMSLPTVAQNLDELQERGLVKKVGSMESTGGRRAVGVTIQASAYYAIGLDITRNHVAVLILNLVGDVVFHERLKLRFENEKSYFRRVGEILDEIIEEQRINPNVVLGVGISVPAIISHDRMMLSYSTVLGSSGITQKDFAEFIRYPCKLCNDAKAAGSAEYRTENGGENMVYLSLSNSVGGAIILSNQILAGDNERNAEFGHMRIEPNGRKCYCGQLGCLDTYCNAMQLSRFEDGNMDRFFAKLSEGNAVYQGAFEEYMSFLALGVNNIRMIFDYKVILGGYVGSYLDPYIDTLREKLKRLNTFEADGSYITACKRKMEASAVGAGYLYLDQFFSNL